MIPTNEELVYKNGRETVHSDTENRRRKEKQGQCALSGDEMVLKARCERVLERGFTNTNSFKQRLGQRGKQGRGKENYRIVHESVCGRK